MLTLGIDLAAQPKNTAACVIRWLNGSAQVEKIDSDLTDLVELISTADKVGIDVPFGWPTDFADAVACHHRFLPWPASPVRKLRYRETDLFVTEKTGLWPLSVSTDRIGVATMRVAGLFARMREPVHRSGNDGLSVIQ